MEEENVLKERLQAITDKRKIQEDISNKRIEIDEEKLKFQYLKKKALRDQWLISEHGCPGGQEHMAARRQMQAEEEQTRILQSNIYRMEKEVEALERQEMIISTNEGFILKRLKALEKSAEDVIKAAKTGTIKESNENIYTTQCAPASTKSPKMKKHSPDLQHDVEQLIPARMEVGQKTKTKEGEVRSTTTILCQRAQQRGTKVCDNGRKSAYSLSRDDSIVQNGVEELSPREVEQLLRSAPPWASSTFVQCPDCRPPSPSWKKHSSNPEQIHSDDGHCQGERKQPQSYIPPYSSGIQVQQPPPDLKQNTKLSVQRTEKRGKNIKNPKPHECRTDFHTNSGSIYRNSPPEQRRNFKADQLSTTPAYLDPCKPVTMIFMGYQHAVEDDETALALGYNGTIQAELVVITSDDDIDDSHHYNTQSSPLPKRPRETQRLPVDSINSSKNVSSSTPYLQDSKLMSNPNISLLDRNTGKCDMEHISNKGSQKVQKRAKHCCSLM